MYGRLWCARERRGTGTVIEFGEGLLTGTVVDTVDDGNRLIQFHYKGIFEEIWTSWGRCPCLLILHTS